MTIVRYRVRKIVLVYNRYNTVVENRPVQLQGDWVCARSHFLQRQWTIHRDPWAQRPWSTALVSRSRAQLVSITRNVNCDHILPPGSGSPAESTPHWSSIVFSDPLVYPPKRRSSTVWSPSSELHHGFSFFHFRSPHPLQISQH